MTRTHLTLLRGTVAALALGAMALAPALAQQQQQQQQRPPAQQQRPPAQQPQRPPQQPAQQQQQTQQQQQQQQQQAAPARPPQVPLPQEGTAIVLADYNSIFYHSAAGQAARTQLERRRTQIQQEITQQENDLRKIQEDLEKQRAILAPDAFGQRQRDFQTRFTNAQQAIQDRGRVLEEAARDSEARIQREIYSIVTEIVQEQRYQVVLLKHLVAFAQPSLEISDEVLKRLNRKMPSFTVNFAKN